jgi:hypothetical protein
LGAKKKEKALACASEESAYLFSGVLDHLKGGKKKERALLKLFDERRRRRRKK